MHHELKKMEQEILRKFLGYETEFNLTSGSQLEESSLSLLYQEVRPEVCGQISSAVGVVWKVKVTYAETVETGDGRTHGTTPLLLVKEKKNQI